MRYKNQKDKYNKYIEVRFSSGLTPYMDSLKKQGVVNKRNILDVGCGPGVWSLAAAKLNPNASVIGIDIREGDLDIAKKFKQTKKIKNCKFLNESYENLLEHFSPASFDVIMCNSVIQYIDEKEALLIFSQLLKKNGILLMFWNHGPGYYLQKLFLGLRNLDIKEALFMPNMFIVGTLKKYVLHRQQGYFVTLKHLRKISKKVGINLVQIENEPKLDYKDTFLGLPCVFSCRGTKTL